MTLFTYLLAQNSPGGGGAGPGGAGGLNGGNTGAGLINNPVLGSIGSITGTSFFSTFFSGLVTLAFVVGTIVFVFMLIMGAISWIGSGGDKGAVEASKSKITNALLGIVILFATYAVIKFVSFFFGDINLLTPALTPLTP